MYCGHARQEQQYTEDRKNRFVFRLKSVCLGEFGRSWLHPLQKNPIISIKKLCQSVQKQCGETFGKIWQL